MLEVVDPKWGGLCRDRGEKRVLPCKKLVILTLNYCLSKGKCLDMQIAWLTYLFMSNFNVTFLT